MRVFYAAGPGDIIKAHRLWAESKDDPDQVALTYSGQFESWCRAANADAYLISSNEKTSNLQDGRFTLEHLPKRPWGGGIGFHFSELLHGWRLYRRAAAFNSDIAFISSGSTHYFALLLMRISGIKIVPVLHNSLWPSGLKPQGGVDEIMMKLNAAMFRRAVATIGISPECLRQVEELTGGRYGRAIEMRPMFRREGFASMAPPPKTPPFLILYTGRITADKGVFDLVETARRVETAIPGMVRWEIFGDGPDIDELRRRALPSMSIKGHCGGDDIRSALGRSHAVIVPTTASFSEGLAKSAVEAILAGRPAIISSVTPAKDVLDDCCVVVAPGDIDGYVAAVLSFVQNTEIYESLRQNCLKHQDQFYDDSNGFAAAIDRALTPTSPTT